MSAALTLTQMTDLALGTPEVGAVNFNVLHSLLHVMIQKLGIADVKSEILKSDKDFLTRKRDEPDAFSTAGTDISDRDSTITGVTDDSGLGGKSADRHGGRSPYHKLEDKVAKLEKQFTELNDLPTNETLYDRAKAKGEGEKPTPVSDMWQAMQLKTRVDANENGISKLMSLMQDVMADTQSLKDQMKTLQDDLAGIKDMEELLKNLREQFAQLPRPDSVVSWDALEMALKGLREGLNALTNRGDPTPALPEQRVVHDVSSQTNLSRPGSSRPGSSKSSPGPSAELQAILEKLGQINCNHDKLAIRVDNVENALDGLDLQSLKDLQGEIDRLKNSMLRDGEAVQKMMENLANLQSELDRIDKLTQQLMDQNSSQQTGIDYTKMQKSLATLKSELDRLDRVTKRTDKVTERLDNLTQQLVDQNTSQQTGIDELYKLCSQLDENKADKEFVQNEVDVKADKKSVVNRSLFDSTCEDLNKMINDILSKLANSDEDWRNLLSQLEGKLDRAEFASIRNELEKQLRALAKRLKEMNKGYDECEDDAAGIRKQLLQKFNCISCDRPVAMAPQGAVPSIPVTTGMPGTRSARPYTTYELDQIRQHAKRLYEGKYDPYVTVSQPTSEVMDTYQTTRACGGSHTLTYPHRRTNRAQQLSDYTINADQQIVTERFWAAKSNVYREQEPEVVVVPQRKGETDIQGADGHIYRGRDPKLLPHLNQGGGMTANKLPKRAQTSMDRPTSTSPCMNAPNSPRPTSARLSRPTSRPQSAHMEGRTDVTIPGVGVASPPPPPEPSEKDAQSLDGH